MHEVMFAVQLQNLDMLEAILLDVSDPSSSNYGLYMTKDEVTELISNPSANAFIKQHIEKNGENNIIMWHCYPSMLQHKTSYLPLIYDLLICYPHLTI